MNVIDTKNTETGTYTISERSTGAMMFGRPRAPRTVYDIHHDGVYCSTAKDASDAEMIRESYIRKNADLAAWRANGCPQDCAE